MADVKLSTTSSIVDYLASVKKPTDFNSRASLYKTTGLESRLGAYTGSSTQNAAFLKALQTPTQTGEVKPQYGPVQQQSTGAPASTSATNYLKTLGSSLLGGAKSALANIPTPGPQMSVGKPATVPNSTSMVNPNQYPKPIGPLQPMQGPQQLTSKYGETAPVGTPGGSDFATQEAADAFAKTKQGGSASGALSYAQGSSSQPLGGAGDTTGGGDTTTDITETKNFEPERPNPPAFAPGGTPTAEDLGIGLPGEADLVNDYFNSEEYKLRQDKYELDAQGEALKAATLKENLEAKYAADKAAVETALGRAGLFMSGIRSTQVAALANSLAMSLNQVDRQTAQKLLESDNQFKTDILKGVEELFKEAKADNKEALAQLNAAGFALIGNSIVPTLAAIKYQSDEERAAFAQELSIANFNHRLDEFSALERQRAVSNQQAVQRLQISMKNAITSAERNAQMAQIRDIMIDNKTYSTPGQIINASTGNPVSLTDGEKTKYAFFDTLLNYYIPELERLNNAVTLGPAQGNYLKAKSKTPLISSTLSNDEQAALRLFGDVANKELYTQSGSQINETEYERIAAALPSLTLSNAQNKTQIEQYKNAVQEVYDARLRVSGYAVAGSPEGQRAKQNQANMVALTMGSGDGLEDLETELGGIEQ